MDVIHADIKLIHVSKRVPGVYIEDRIDIIGYMLW